MLKRFIAIILLIPLVFLCSCRVQAAHPEQGVWYCEELKMSINFSLFGKTSEMVRIYSDDGTFNTFLCHIDFGNGIYIDTLDGSETIYRGNFKLRGEDFNVKIDDTTYIFNEIATEPTQ